MDFREFYKNFAATTLEEAKKESTAEKDDKAEKAGKEVAKDIEYDDKKDKKKKSLKDWFEAIDKKTLNEADLPLPILGKDGKAVSAQPGFLKMQGTDPTSKAMGDMLKDLVAQKKIQVVAPIAAPATGTAAGAAPTAPAAPGGTQPVGTAVKEEQLDEKAPPGMEDVVLSLKKKYPGEEGRAYAIAWSMYNKKHGKNEGAEDNPASAMLDEKEDKWIKGAIKHPGAFTKKAKSHGMTTSAFAKKVLANKDDYPAKTEKQAQLAKTLSKLKEVDQPTMDNMSAMGAGLGAGREPGIPPAKDPNKSKQVKESMNTLEAAYHEGKSHGLSKSNYACRYNEGSEEHKRYHDGFKEGLDECYGLMPNRGLVVSEVDVVPATVPGMADQAEKASGLGEMDKTAYMQQKAKTTPGDTFKAFGQTMHDKDVLEADAFAFESLDKQLNALLTEGEETVAEGLSVNMSQGLGSGMGDDSVSVSATGDDAGKLLDFIKQVGLGGLGGAQATELVGGSEPITVSDYGAPKFGGYENDGPSSMMDLIKKVSGGDEDYKDEKSHDHMHGEVPEVKMCETHGMDEGKCGCGESKKMVDEVETQDQLTDQMAEDDGEGNIEADEQGAQIDAALAVGSENEKAVTEAGDGGEEASPEADGSVAAADAAEEEEAAMSESSFLNLYKKLALISEESTKKEDEKAEKAGEKVTKDIEYDDKKDKKDKKEKVDEWANDAGKDGTQQTFERDIEFMTKVISGGLNKPKSTGQQTIPVLAGDKERIGDEDMAEFRRLAGLGQ